MYDTYVDEDLYVESGSFGDEVNFLIKEYLKGNLHTCIPAIIVDFDATKQRASVQPSVKQLIRQDSGEKITFIDVNRPQSLDVPVHFPQGGGFSLTFPIVAGDECLLIFGERDIENWKNFGGIQPASKQQQFEVEDSFALVGFSSLPQVIPNFSTTDVQLRNEAATQTISLRANSDIDIDTTANVNITTSGTTNITSTGETNITASQVNVDTPLADFTTDVNIQGNLTVTGEITSSTGMKAPLYGTLTGLGGSMTIADIQVLNNVTINGKSVVGHDHSNGNNSPF